MVQKRRVGSDDDLPPGPAWLASRSKVFSADAAVFL